MYFYWDTQKPRSWTQRIKNHPSRSESVVDLYTDEGLIRKSEGRTVYFHVETEDEWIVETEGDPFTPHIIFGTHRYTQTVWDTHPLCVQRGDRWGLASEQKEDLEVVRSWKTASPALTKVSLP